MTSPAESLAKPASDTRRVTGNALAQATAMSAPPDAASPLTANTPRDQAWFEASVPCRTACPAGTDIPGYLDAIRRGEDAAAYRINLEQNVFPGVLGRVCSRPCEDACRHGAAGNGEPVAICASKRAAADHRASAEELVLLPQLFAASGKHVAVIGAGVAGLTCARELARRGHRVTVFEKHAAAGGMLIQGIPVFRLPRSIVQREIAQIAALGVEIRCGVDVGNGLALEQLSANHDAVVIAAGTLAPNIPRLDTADSGAEHGLKFLLEVNEFARSEVLKHAVPGAEVWVIGGGYTALDCARTALRMGARVNIAYRRARAAMTVLAGEIEEFKREGGTLHTQLAPLKLLANAGRATGVQFARTHDNLMRDGAVEIIAGSEFEAACDHLIFATGQHADHAWLPAVVAAKLSERSEPAAHAPLAASNMFTAGDFALGASNLISAIGHAKHCAATVDHFLTGRVRIRSGLRVSAAMYSKPATGFSEPHIGNSLTGRDATLNRIPLVAMPLQASAERSLHGEVELGYDTAQAQTEASRCYLCNYKFEIIDRACVLCDECLRVMPVKGCIVEIAGLSEDAEGRVTGYQPVIRDRSDSLYYNRLWIDPSRCIRCGACEAACPVNAISVQKVSCESSCR